MSWTNFLGIYPDAIDRVFDTCQDAIEDIRDFAEKLGYDKDAECLDFDLNEAVLDSLASNGFDAYDMTNSLINACFFVVQGELENTQFCKDFELTFDTFTNCDDSHLYVKHNGVTEEYHETGNVKELLEGILTEHLSDIVYDKLLNDEELSEDDLPDDWYTRLKACIAEDLPYFDDEDIVACYSNWQITGTIRETVDYVLSAQREAERTPPVASGRNPRD